MVFTLVAMAIPALWIAAVLTQRKVQVSSVWLGFDAGVGVVIAVALAVQGRIAEGIFIALAVVPVLMIFSALRTLQMRYIDRKARTILDGVPPRERARPGDRI
jgi:hypothetical protein